MRALAVTPGQQDSARIVAVPDPRPTGEQIVVETLEVGICGTDRTIVAGKYGVSPAGHERLIIGHEALGIVRSAGAGFGQGDLVAATVRRPCGQCPNCETGQVDACTTGRFTERGIIGLDGFAGELFVESPANLIAVPRDLGRLGVLAEPMSICERGWRHANYVGVRQGWRPRRVLVLGVGAIGVLSVFRARLAGLETWAYARRPTDSARAELIRATGAEYASAAEVTLSQLVGEVGEPDLILEAAGDAELSAQAIGCLATNGVLCLRGITARPGQISIAAGLLTDDLVLRNKSVIGSTNAAPVDWDMGVIDLSAIADRWPEALSAVVDLKVGPEDFARALNHDGVKATIRFA